MPKGATISHIFPALRNRSLLSVGQLCDHRCEEHFDTNKVTISHRGKTMLTGKRSKGTLGKLRILNPYSPPPAPAAPPPAKGKIHRFVNVALNQDTKENRIAFYHTSLFSPVLSTWCDTIDVGRFTTWPGLISSHVGRYPTQSIAMHMGHLDQQRSNARSA
jgi:hypothetical protein